MLVAFLLLWALGSAAIAAPQRLGQKGGMEEFAAADPYTKGDAELRGKLGYTRLGHGAWHDGEDTKALQRNLGGTDMLFVETAHFRIGSSLGTYRIPNNRDERDRVKEELQRLKRKLGRLKAPKNELDPWLRLHLYAQRAEEQYAILCEEFQITPEETGLSPRFPGKLLLILCERKSEFGRYVRHYHESTVEGSYRDGWPGDTMVVAACFEALTEGWEQETELPFDTMLHNLVATRLTASLLDAHGGDLLVTPLWFTFGLSHSHLRRIDPHWNLFDGRASRQAGDRDQWDWEPRVRKLVKNEFFAGAEEMFAWQAYEGLHERDHLVAWSKVEFLMTEVEGDRGAFLAAICSATDGAEEDLVVRQRAALKEHFGLTPEGFDRAWSKWVLKTYRKR